MCCSYGTAGVLAGEFCKGRLKGMPARTPALPSLPARTVKKIIQPCLTLLNLVCWGFNLVCNLVGTLLEPCWNLQDCTLQDGGSTPHPDPLLGRGGEGGADFRLQDGDSTPHPDPLLGRGGEGDADWGLQDGDSTPRPDPLLGRGGEGDADCRLQNGDSTPHPDPLLGRGGEGDADCRLQNGDSTPHPDPLLGRGGEGVRGQV